MHHLMDAVVKYASLMCCIMSIMYICVSYPKYYLWVLWSAIAASSFANILPSSISSFARVYPSRIFLCMVLHRPVIPIKIITIYVYFYLEKKLKTLQNVVIGLLIMPKWQLHLYSVTGTLRRYCLSMWSHLSLLCNQYKPQVIRCYMHI